MNEVNAILVEIINMDPRDTVKLVNAAARLVLAERSRCADEVSAEGELEGPMPDENWALAQKCNLESHLRVTVRTCKRNILERILNPKR